MRILLTLLALSLAAPARADVSPISASPISASPINASPINAIVGDASWIARHGHAPTAEEDRRERDRIQTHLAWVEAELRRRLVPGLSPERKARRARLLDELAEYRGRARFPANERYASRRPRFRDGEAVCAVGRLIEVSAGRALTDAIARRFEYAYLLAIDDPRLTEWIAGSGFTPIELAMIQPSYSRPVPPPPPEPWTETKLKVLLASFGTQIERCAEGERTRAIRVRVRYDREGLAGMIIRARPANGGVQSCVEAALSRTLSRARAVAPRERIAAARIYRLRLRPDARARELAARTIDARLASFERCMPPDRSGRLAVLRVRVDEAGQLALVRARTPAPPRPGPRSIGSTWSREQVLACFEAIVSHLQVDPPPRPVLLTHRVRWGGSFSSLVGLRIAPGRRFQSNR